MLNSSPPQLVAEGGKLGAAGTFVGGKLGVGTLEASVGASGSTDSGVVDGRVAGRGTFGAETAPEGDIDANAGLWRVPLAISTHSETGGAPLLAPKWIIEPRARAI